MLTFFTAVFAFYTVHSTTKKIMKRFEEQNYYEMLEIRFDASSSTIDRAFKNTLAIYSEDSLLTYSLFTSDEREAVLKKLAEAYNTLNDPKKRRIYNERLGLYQIDRDNQKLMNIDTNQPLKDRQDIAHPQATTNRNHPSILTRKSDAETGPNPLHGPVQFQESRFLRKNLYQVLYSSAAITVLLLFLALVSYGALNSWNFLKLVYSTRSEDRLYITGKTSKSLVRMPIPEQKKPALSEEREIVQEKDTGKVEAEALLDNPSEVYLNLASVANIRSSPDINSRIVIRIHRGKEINVIGKTGEWLMLELGDGAIGWIHQSLACKKELITPLSMVE